MIDRALQLAILTVLDPLADAYPFYSDLHEQRAVIHLTPTIMLRVHHLKTAHELREEIRKRNSQA